MPSELPPAEPLNAPGACAEAMGEVFLEMHAARVLAGSVLKLGVCHGQAALPRQRRGRVMTR